jgi:hypothetical protein
MSAASAASTTRSWRRARDPGLPGRALLASRIGRPAADVVLDPVEFADASQRLRRDRALGSASAQVLVPPRSARMRPARRLASHSHARKPRAHTADDLYARGHVLELFADVLADLPKATSAGDAATRLARDGEPGARMHRPVYLNFYNAEAASQGPRRQHADSTYFARTPATGEAA